MKELAKLAEELRQFVAIKYMGDCKCGECQLVPLEFIYRLYAALGQERPPITNDEDGAFWQARS